MRMSRNARLSSDEGGFSLIELLVVILIVAVLAAIAIPLFLSSRDRGFAAQVQSALKSASIAAESAAAASGGYLALDDNEALLSANGFNPTESVELGITATEDTFCIAAVHDRASTDNDWRIGSYSSTIGKPVAGGATCAAATVLAGITDIPPVAVVEGSGDGAAGGGSGDAGGSAGGDTSGTGSDSGAPGGSDTGAVDPGGTGTTGTTGGTDTGTGGSTGSTDGSGTGSTSGSTGATGSGGSGSGGSGGSGSAGGNGNASSDGGGGHTKPKKK